MTRRRPCANRCRDSWGLTAPEYHGGLRTLRMRPLGVRRSLDRESPYLGPRCGRRHCEGNGQGTKAEGRQAGPQEVYDPARQAGQRRGPWVALVHACTATTTGEARSWWATGHSAFGELSANLCRRPGLAVPQGTQRVRIGPGQTIVAGGACEGERGLRKQGRSCPGPGAAPIRARIRVLVTLAKLSTVLCGTNPPTRRRGRSARDQFTLHLENAGSRG